MFVELDCELAIAFDEPFEVVAVESETQADAPPSPSVTEEKWRPCWIVTPVESPALAEDQALDPGRRRSASASTVAK